MKLFSSILLLLSIIIHTLFAQVPVDSSKIDLQLNLQAGEAYSYSTSINQQVTQEILGKIMEVNQQIAMEYKYAIESNDGKVMKIKANFEKMQLIFDTPQGKTEYNSELPNTSNSISVLNDLIGKTFYLFIDSKGKVYKIEGFKELAKKLKLSDTVKKMFTDSALIRSLNMDIYAGHPVAIGENWNKSDIINLDNLKLNNNLKYTLEGTSEDLAWLNVDGEVSLLTKNTNFEIDLKGTQNGTIEADLKTGAVSSSDLKMEIEGNIKSQETQIPLKLMSEIKTELKKI